MMEEVERIVASHFGVTSEQLRKGNSENQQVADAKHFLWYILFTVMGYKWSDISKEYNTTKRNLLYSVAKIRDGIRIHPFYTKHLGEIQRELKELNLL